LKRAGSALTRLSPSYACYFFTDVHTELKAYERDELVIDAGTVDVSP